MKFRLKSGKTIEGELVTEVQGVLKIKTETQVFNIPWTSIEYAVEDKQKEEK